MVICMEVVVWAFMELMAPSVILPPEAWIIWMRERASFRYLYSTN
jgi:hypothetical protein